MKANKLNKLIIIFVFFGLINISFARIVFDPKNYANNVENFAKQIAQFKQQIDNQLKQLEAMQNQFAAITGNRNLGEILKDENIEQLPKEWESIYNKIPRDYNKLLAAKKYNSEDNLIALAQSYEISKSAYKDIMQGFERINLLMQEINKTTDPKAAQDLSNRLAIEQANIQNNQARLDTMSKLIEQEQKIRDARYIQREKCFLQAMYKGENNHKCK